MLRKISAAALLGSLVAHGVLLKVADEAFSVAVPEPLPEMTLVDVLIPPDPPPAAALPEPPAAVNLPKPQPKPKPKPKREVRPQSQDEAMLHASVPPPVAEPLAIPEPAQPPGESTDGEPEPPLAGEQVAALGGAGLAHQVAPELQETMDDAAPAEEALDPKAFDLSSWPASGSILYRVMYGEGGFQVGEAEHRWSHDGERYEMQTRLQTTGVTALFRRFQYVQRSVGALGKSGLRPERFSVEQAGRKPESASFDWDAGQVTIQRKKGPRTAPIRPGDQDVLSLWHQIGIVGAEGLPLELTVVSNKAASPSRLSAVGVEAAALPIGRLDTLHLRAQANDGELSIDIWLARRYGMLPVRIRITDDKGEIFDQQAVHLRLAPPPGAAEDDGADTRIVELREQSDPFTLYK